jgi:hypothetical protein
LPVIDSPTTLLVVLGAVFLLVGCVLDVSPAVLLFGPVLLPLVTAVGGDPIFFGVMMVFALAIGLITPPVGTTMMLSAYIAGVTILDVARESVPYLIYMIVLLYVLIFFRASSCGFPTISFTERGSRLKVTAAPYYAATIFEEALMKDVKIELPYGKHDPCRCARKNLIGPFAEGRQPVADVKREVIRALARPDRLKPLRELVRGATRSSLSPTTTPA